MAAVVSAVFLAGCTRDAEEVQDAPETTATQEGQSSPPESPAQPTAAATQDDADLDSIGGVRTQDFLGLPEQLGSMSQVEAETDPSLYLASVHYASDDASSQLRFQAEIPVVGGQARPLEGTDDRIFDEALQRGVEMFEDDGDEIRRFSSEGGGFGWECIEAERTAGTDDDHFMCLSAAYGRIIEVQYLSVHDEDQAAREGNMGAMLAEIGEAVAGLA